MTQERACHWQFCSTSTIYTSFGLAQNGFGILGNSGLTFCQMLSQTSLVAADRLWQSKREILDSVGFDSPQEFPISVDGMPQQLLSYLRLARLQNSAEFAKVLFSAESQQGSMSERLHKLPPWKWHAGKVAMWQISFP